MCESRITISMESRNVYRQIAGDRGCERVKEKRTVMMCGCLRCTSPDCGFSRIEGDSGNHSTYLGGQLYQTGLLF